MSYGITTTADTTVEEALVVVREALSAQGFGKRLPAGVGS